MPMSGLLVGQALSTIRILCTLRAGERCEAAAAEKLTSSLLPDQRPVSRKLRKLFGPEFLKLRSAYSEKLVYYYDTKGQICRKIIITLFEKKIRFRDILILTEKLASAQFFLRRWST